MNSKICIGIIGDYDGRPSHIATEEALKHAGKKIEIDIEFKWLPSVMFDSVKHELQYFDGLWCAPGSPYKSMNGVINAIKFARESDCPFIGTCGGFQHAVIEFGRNVLHISALEDTNFNPYEPNDYIIALSCSLVGETRHIILEQNSRLHNVYGSAEIVEKYNCSFELNKNFQTLLNKSGFKVIGVDENEEARIMTIENNTFFIASLFQPQLSSTFDKPHPLVIEYLNSVRAFKNSR